MRRCVTGSQTNCGLELGNGSFNISKTEKPLSGVGIEGCGLQAGFVLADLSAQKSLPGGAIFIPQLMQDDRKSGVRSGEIGLASLRDVAASCNFPCCFSTVPRV